MVTRILDTSVAIAWYVPEAFSAEARAWRERLLAGEVRFVVPSLHFWELGNVLRTYVRRGELDETTAREVYRLHLSLITETAEPRREEVLETALRYESTVYDAVYIVLARTLGAPLLTAERTTTPWVAKLGKLADSILAQ